MRPGRLDRILYVGPPDLAAREEILRIRMRSMTVEPNIDIPVIAKFVCLPNCILRCLYLLNDAADRWMLGRRDYSPLPGSCHTYDAAGH